MPEKVAVRNPYTGVEDYAFIAPAATDVAAVCDRLQAGQKAWAAKTIDQRAAVLRDFAVSIEKHREQLQ